MEKITIENIEEKGKAFIVTYNGGKKAGIAPWMEQERDFVLKDIGLGGSFDCVIEQKGDYTNITDINMSTAVKGNLAVPVIKVADKLMSNKDEMIIAQVFVKCAASLAEPHKFENSDALGEYMAMCVNELTGAYKLALTNLKAL